MTIGENIKKARKRAGLTQSQLGEKLHVSNIMIAMYETGKRNPKEETLQKIAEALNTTVYELRGIDFSEIARKLSDFDQFDKFYLEDMEEIDIISNLRSLNRTGKKEAIKRVEELTHIDRYTKEE